MAVVLAKVGNSINTPLNHYKCDTITDMNGIDTDHVPFGSTCYVINDGVNYVLNSSKLWKIETIVTTTVAE